MTVMYAFWKGGDLNSPYMPAYITPTPPLTIDHFLADVAYDESKDPIMQRVLALLGVEQ